jgi:hypothetical protein
MSLQIALQYSGRHDILKSFRTVLTFFLSASDFLTRMWSVWLSLYRRQLLHKYMPVLQCLSIKFPKRVFKKLITTFSWGCRIWGFHGGDYEECRLLGCGALWVYCNIFIIIIIIYDNKTHTGPYSRRRHSSTFPGIYLSRDNKSVSELWGQRLVDCKHV